MIAFVNILNDTYNNFFFLILYSLTNIYFLFLFLDVPKIIYKCPNAGCTRSYKTKPGIYTHLKDECGVEPKFRCKHCLKAFKRKWSFQSHILHVHRSLIAFNKEMVCNEETPVMFGSYKDSKTHN